MIEHQISLCTEPSLFVYLGTRKVWRKKGEFKSDKANILPSFTLSTQSLPNIIVCIVQRWANFLDQRATSSFADQVKGRMPNP